MEKGSNIKREWLATNKKYIPKLFYLGLGLNIIFIPVIVTFGDEQDWTLLSVIRDAIGTFLYFLIIPLMVINLIFFLKKTYFSATPPWRFIWIMFLALFVGITLGSFICEALIEAMNLMGLERPEAVAQKEFKLKTIVILNNLLGFLVGVPLIIKSSRKEEIINKLKEKDMELNRLQQIQTKVQLELLQSKINPHFLYNSLNSIASLAHEDPQKVEKMAISLSKLFRYSINTSSNSFSTIKEEMELVKTYLEIEKIRFGEKLEFEINIIADESLTIPRFLIQPLVENALKHGISKITGKGKIVVSVNQEEDGLVIFVQDNGPAFPEDLMSGHGIQSTQEKLCLLFKDNYELNLINGESKQVRIVLRKLIKHEKV